MHVLALEIQLADELGQLCVAPTCICTREGQLQRQVLYLVKIISNQMLGLHQVLERLTKNGSQVMRTWALWTRWEAVLLC